MPRRFTALLVCCILGTSSVKAGEDDKVVKDALAQMGVERGLCVLVGEEASLALPLARKSELTIFVQLADAKEVAELRAKLDVAGLLGTRVHVRQGSYDRLHLADDLADAMRVGKTATISKDEVLRVLRPHGKAQLGAMELVKPAAKGTGEWTHPYHAADNNPQASDQVARRPFLTHFLAEPWYCPLTQITVVSGGRMFKAFGDRSSAKPQEDLLGKLIAMNVYNGTLLWKRDLSPGFMIHRNTMVATPTTLYVGDDKSCKLIDAATGTVRDEIVIPEGVAEGPVWKWMALEDGVLYAMVGEKEASEVSFRGDRIRGAGWPWWKYNAYKYGFGKTLLAIDPASKKILWTHKEPEVIDGRAVCMKSGRLYYYSEDKFLGCLDARSGKVVWKTSDPKLLEAIGTTGQAQHWMLGFASTAYLKCSDNALFFGGPQRPNLVGVSAQDGKLLWKHAGGNSQLVLRPEGLYALGEGRTNSAASSLKLHPLTGKVLATFPSRDRCTRATGCVDSIFTRGGAGGSTAVFDVTTTEPRMGTLAPMRPACTDGVVVAHGHLFWGPWMCACDQTQIGVISLGPGGGFDYNTKAKDAERLEIGPAYKNTGPAVAAAQDWATYRQDNARGSRTEHVIPAAIKKVWEYQPPHASIPAAPVTAGGMVFVSGADGVVRALDAEQGKPRWTAYTGGPIKYPPSVWQDRALVGSGDGWIYCFEAATGKLMWRFRAAPVERTIPVYGTLQSNWPVASGVMVHDGVAYAAAGMFNYDGTHVYALDVLTGKMRWQNNTTGKIGKESPDSGVSVQGHLLLHGGAIHMPAGNKPTVASYALADGAFTAKGQGRGKHLFLSKDQVKATGFPLYWRPDDDHFLTALQLESSAGTLTINTAQLALLGPAGDPKRPLWTASPCQEIAAVALGKNAALVTGVQRDKAGKITAQDLFAINLADGKLLWKEPLPAAPVAWGLALDRSGQILVSVMDGRVLAFGKK